MYCSRLHKIHKKPVESMTRTKEFSGVGNKQNQGGPRFFLRVNSRETSIFGKLTCCLRLTPRSALPTSVFWRRSGVWPFGRMNSALNGPCECGVSFPAVSDLRRHHLYWRPLAMYLGELYRPHTTAPQMVVYVGNSPPNHLVSDW